MFERRLPIGRSLADDLADSLVQELGGAAAAMRCSPSPGGWGLDFLSAEGSLATTAAEHFRDYILSAPPDFTLWDPTNVAPALRNTIQVVDNRLFGEVDVVKRVYAPLGLDRLAHLTMLASTGPRFLGWVGLWREEPFTAAEVHRLSSNAPAIRKRLMTIDELGSAELSWSIVESTLEAMQRPAFLVKKPCRIELSNAAGRVLLNASRRSVLRTLELALAGGSADWTVTPLLDAGMPDLALVSQSVAGVTFETRLELARREWRLTDTQVAVLRLVARGLANKEIATELGRAAGTTELHVSAILKRAEVDSRGRLLAKFWETLGRG